MQKLLEKVALKSPHKSSHHAAAVVKNGRILAIKENQYGRHAETRAVKASSYELRKGASVWVIRVMKNGRISNSLPCDECIDYLRYSEISDVYYSNENGDIIRWKL